MIDWCNFRPPAHTHTHEPRHTSDSYWFAINVLWFQRRSQRSWLVPSRSYQSRDQIWGPRLCGIEQKSARRSKHGKIGCDTAANMRWFLCCDKSHPGLSVIGRALKSVLAAEPRSQQISTDLDGSMKAHVRPTCSRWAVSHVSITAKRYGCVYGDMEISWMGYCIFFFISFEAWLVINIKKIK